MRAQEATVECVRCHRVVSLSDHLSHTNAADTVPEMFWDELASDVQRRDPVCASCARGEPPEWWSGGWEW